MSVAQQGISSWAAPAGADLTGKLFYFATFDTNANIIVNASANGAVAGVIIEEATSGNAASIQTDGIAKVQANGVIAAGAGVSSDATGQAVSYVSGPVIGVAFAAASGAGIIIPVKLS
jgi:predicted TIM-barrel enzyme